MLYIDNYGRVRNDELYHHGILGMHWGIRRFQPYPSGYHGDGKYVGKRLKNRTPAKVSEVKNYRGKLYFISEDNLDGKTLKPRVPQNYFTKNGYEDDQTPRVCFTPSVDQCLTALSQNVKGKTFTVYEPDTKPSKIYKPNKGAVPDSEVTGELWVQDPVKLKKVGKVYVTGDDGKAGKQFEYGANSKAELYGWNYDWVKKLK